MIATYATQRSFPETQVAPTAVQTERLKFCLSGITCSENNRHPACSDGILTRYIQAMCCIPQSWSSTERVCKVSFERNEPGHSGLVVS